MNTEVKAVELEDGKVIDLNRILRLEGISLDTTKDYFPNLRFTIILDTFNGIDEVIVKGRLEFKRAYFKNVDGHCNSRTAVQYRKGGIFPIAEYYDPEDFIFEKSNDRIKSRVILTNEGNYIAAIEQNMKKFKGYAEFKKEYDSLVRLWNNGKAVEKTV
jgi:hypothetical protein